MRNLIKTAALLTAASVTAGLALTGRKIGWGPLKNLYDWEKEIEPILNQYDCSRRKHEIIFYGASNFRLWKEMENDLCGYKVQNHGFGGSTDEQLMKYAERLLYPYEPKIVFLQTGSNDYVSLKGSDEQKAQLCMQNKRKMLGEFQKNLPDTVFVIMSGLLLPGRSQYRELTEMINGNLKEFCEENDKTIFIDASDLTYQNGIYRKDLFIRDQIHLNHEGQLSWMKDYIQPAIEQAIETFHLDEVRRI